MTLVYKILDNNGVREATAEERAEIDSLQKPINWAERKLAEIRKIRNQKLQETDWLVISEQITDAEKTWRENLRKIPQDYTTENQYDLLLARNDDGKLTHSIWEKP